MRLITRRLYEEQYEPNERLIIRPYKPENFFSGSYSFRLGGVETDSGPLPLTSPLELSAGSVAHVWSKESFSMRGRALAIIGGSTSLIAEGIQLIHSPCIDPDFDGVLELWLRNFTDCVKTLLPEQIIGKAAFFDVSEGDKGILEEQSAGGRASAFAKRKQAATRLRELAEISVEHRLRMLDDPEINPSK